jgi:1,4-alpha-glucan branching enzyme
MDRRQPLGEQRDQLSAQRASRHPRADDPFTSVLRHNHRVGVPRGGFWREILNSDAREFGGSGHGNMGDVEAAPVAAHGRPFSLNLTLPPLSTLFFNNKET